MLRERWSVWQLLKEPEKSIVMRIAKRKMKKSTISVRRMMFGMARPSETMAILRPFYREISLSGRRIFKILMALRKPTSTLSPAITSIRAAVTIVKSRMFHDSRR